MFYKIQGPPSGWAMGLLSATPQRPRAFLQPGEGSPVTSRKLGAGQPRTERTAPVGNCLQLYCPFTSWLSERWVPLAEVPGGRPWPSPVSGQAAGGPVTHGWFLGGAPGEGRCWVHSALAARPAQGAVVINGCPVPAERKGMGTDTPFWKRLATARPGMERRPHSAPRASL